MILSALLAHSLQTDSRDRIAQEILSKLTRMTPEEQTWGCPPPVAPYQHTSLNEEKVVARIVFPLIGKPRWHNSYNNDRGNFFHTGIDMSAPKMTPILAPFSGLLGMRPETFWIYAEDGWSMLGTHLNDDTPGTNDNSGSQDFMFAPNLHPGMFIEQGQLVGYVGNSGDATGPHLHFEIFAPPSRGERWLPAASRLRNPLYSLQAAKVLSSPRAITRPDLPGPVKGELRFDGCLRGTNEQTGDIYVILTAKEPFSGAKVAYSKPTYRKFHLSEAQLASLGGWAALKLPRWQTIAVYTSEQIGSGTAPATKVLL